MNSSSRYLIWVSSGNLRFISFLSLVSSLSVLLACPLIAGVNTWTTGGPNVGYINCLTIDPSAPSTVFAGAGLDGSLTDGVYKTTDGGETWKQVGLSTGNGILSIAVDPYSASTIYAGTEYPAGTLPGGVYKTIDGGGTWALITQDLPPTYNKFSGLAIDPSAPSIIYVSTSDGVLKTSDGGNSWEITGLQDATIACLAINRSMPLTLYAGGSVGHPYGFYKTLDGGSSWFPITDHLTGEAVRSIAIAADSPFAVYAGVSRQGGGGGVIKLDLGDDYWLTTSLMDRAIWALAIDPVSPSTIYAGTDNGILRTNDAGETWASFGLTDHAVHAISMSSSLPRTIYAGTWSGDVWSITLSYKVSGTISGAVVAGVTLTLSGAVSSTTISDANGTYTFSGLSNGSYTVTPSLSGYIFSPPSQTVTINDSHQTAINFTSAVATSNHVRPVSHP